MAYLHEFGPDDIFLNRMITNPSYEFLMYSGSAYINNDRFMGANIPTGSISLYEYNVDRDGTAQQLIYPFLIKDGSWLAFPSVTTSSYTSLPYGTVITGSYPLSASMYRQYYHPTADPFPAGTNAEKNAYTTNRRELMALQNTMNYYRNISNKYDYTGSLMDEAVDSLQNGELISTMGDTAGSVVGMVLYNEGFVLLTSSVSINTTSYDDYLGTGNAATNVNPNWTYFGSYLPTSSAEGFPTASISALTFKGTHKIPTMTMFATIQPGEANNSLNPTWISSSNGDWRNRTVTGSTGYVEPRQLVIKNTIQSQYCDFEEGFSKQTFITEVGIYDDDKNLIGIAKLANPVMKQELDEYTFKLKLDL